MEAFARLRTWAGWLEATGHSPATVRAYRYWLIRYIADTLADPWEATEDDLVSYLVALPRHGSSRREWLKAVKSYWTWAAPKAGRDPTERLHLRRPQQAPPDDVLSRDDVRQIVRAAFRREPRRGWAILLAVSTGLRVGSLVALRPDDCHGDWLWTSVAKGGRRQRVVLSRPARLAVRHLLATANGTLLGVGKEAFRRWLRVAAADASVHRRVYPHLLRHTFATRVAKVSDPRTWQAAMGHADLSQYPRYVHLDEERLRAAVETVIRGEPR